MEWRDAEINSETKASKLPRCAFCDDTACYDGKTQMGPAAYMCERHFARYGVGLGLNKGQWLVELKIKRRPTGKSENVFTIAGRIAAILQKSGKPENTKDFCDRFFQCTCYEDALALIREYATVY